MVMMNNSLMSQLERIWARLRHMSKMARLYNTVYSSQCRMEVVGATEMGSVVQVTPALAVSGMMSRLGRVGQIGSRNQPGPSTRNYVEGNEAILTLLMSQPFQALRILMERAGVEGEYMGDDGNGSHFITVYA